MTLKKSIPLLNVFLERQSWINDYTVYIYIVLMMIIILEVIGREFYLILPNEYTRICVNTSKTLFTL
jgi:hypothetical protein